MLGAIANQQSIMDSIGAEDSGAGDGEDDQDEYPSFDMEALSRQIGDY